MLLLLLLLLIISDYFFQANLSRFSLILTHNIVDSQPKKSSRWFSLPVQNSISADNRLPLIQDGMSKSGGCRIYTCIKTATMGFRDVLLKVIGK